MKTTSYLKISLLSLMTMGALASCVKSDDFDTPNFKGTDRFDVPNSTISDVKAKAPSDYKNTYFFPKGAGQENVIFDGYVVSSDEQGNFYKTLVIQDKPIGATAGIQVAVNKGFLYTDFPIGAHIRVMANGLTVGQDRGVIKLGYGTPTGQIPQSQISEFLSGVNAVNHMDVATIVPKVYDNLKDALTDNNINTLVTIKNVEFKDADGKLTYADYLQKATADRIIVDKDGNEAVVRNSGYARFAGTVLPTGSGEITVVVSKYQTKDTVWQLYINSLEDVKFTDERFTLSKDTPQGTILGGDKLEYKTSFVQNFDDLKVEDSKNKNYNIKDGRFINYLESGDKFWTSGYFSKTKERYLMAQAFKTTSEAPVVTYFMIPAEFTGSNKISFQTKDGYNKGDVLKVYYTTKYQPGKELKDTDLVDITNQFQISSGNTSGYAKDWVNSGEYKVPTSGRGFIVFAYKGSKTVTTTIQVDNVTLQ